MEPQVTDERQENTLLLLWGWMWSVGPLIHGVILFKAESWSEIGPHCRSIEGIEALGNFTLTSSPSFAYWFLSLSAGTSGRFWL